MDFGRIYCPKKPVNDRFTRIGHDIARKNETRMSFHGRTEWIQMIHQIVEGPVSAEDHVPSMKLSGQGTAHGRSENGKMARMNQ
jgi:hypothetical protein